MTSEVDGVYSVDLLCAHPPELSKARLTAALQAHCPDIEPLSRDKSSDLLAFAHSKHFVEYKEGRVPAQLVLFPGDRGQDAARVEESLQQSWAQKDARDLVASAPYKVWVSDLMAGGLPPKDRLGLFLDALAGILEVVPCRAIHWRTSQQVLSPKAFLSARKGASGQVLFAGPLNVRFFNISNGRIPGEKVTDTMGLAVLGLPDLQCHFHGLEVDDVVRLLYNLGLYIFDNGDVIEDGHTVTGVRGDERWRCQHEDALVAPSRVVLDINPGPEFAAGGRS